MQQLSSMLYNSKYSKSSLHTMMQGVLTSFGNQFMGVQRELSTNNSNLKLFPAWW